MKRTLATFAFLAALPLAAAAQASKEDIKKLVAAGVSEEVVLTYVRANGPMPKLSADEIIELKQAGAGEKLLSALAAGTTTAPAPAPRTEVVERVVEKPVYVPSSTYVYTTPSASSYWCSSHYSYDGCHTYVRPIVSYGYSSWYPRSYWGGYYGGYYGGYGRHCSPGYYSRGRVGISVGWRW